ncbi:MAG TPA: hypothetical protein VF914_17650 [Chloroflexia bacterium]|jgi:hypothetical protein
MFAIRVERFDLLNASAQRNDFALLRKWGEAESVVREGGSVQATFDDEVLFRNGRAELEGLLPVCSVPQPSSPDEAEGNQLFGG